MTFEIRSNDFFVWGIYNFICRWFHVYLNFFVFILKYCCGASLFAFARMVLIISGTKEVEVIGKDDELFLSFFITSLSVPHRQVFFSYHYGENAITPIELYIEF